jgi:hypothetical protein
MTIETARTVTVPRFAEQWRAVCDRAEEVMAAHAEGSLSRSRGPALLDEWGVGVAAVAAVAYQDGRVLCWLITARRNIAGQPPEVKVQGPWTENAFT